MDFTLTLYSLKDNALEKNDEAMTEKKQILLGQTQRERERERGEIGMVSSLSQRLVDQNAEKVGRGEKNKTKRLFFIEE